MDSDTLEHITGDDDGIITEQEQWEMFDAAARRDLGMSGLEFAKRWDRGDYRDRDESDEMFVAGLRPYGWPKSD